MGSVTQQFCLRWNNHQTNLLSAFDEHLQSEEFTDVTLVCDGGSSMKCHRMVLAACSPYFQNLFADLPCKHPVVVLKDITLVEIKAILEYMYRGEVNIAQDQLAALLKVAESLKVKGLVEETRAEETQRDSRSRHEESAPQQSPTGISTTTLPPSVHSSSSNNNNNSPPHSTNGINYKSPYSLYGKAPSIERNSRINMPMWNIPGLPLPHHPPPVQQQNHHHPATMLGYESPNSEMAPLKRKKYSSSNILGNRDTPILRTVLGQGQPDSSQPVSLVCHSDNPDRSSDRGSDQNSPEARQERHNIKNEPSEDAQSPYTDLSFIDDEEKMKIVHSPSQQSYSTDIKGISSGIATYVPTQKPEWKRYKQYTRNDIMSAIEAVRNGMSALQAARKYGVPSRTLYDKVKKLGITTSRPFKRGSNGSSACFPYGLSGTNSPYDNDDHPMNNNSALLEASNFLQHALDGRSSDERDALAAMAAAAAAHAIAAGRASPPNHPMPRSPSPSQSISMMKYMRPGCLTPSPLPGSEHHHSETNGSSERDCEDDGDHVEDLSISRKQESRVIVPPMNQVSTIIKKEDVIKEFKEDHRREVSVDEAE